MVMNIEQLNSLECEIKRNIDQLVDAYINLAFSHEGLTHQRDELKAENKILREENAELLSILDADEMVSGIKETEEI